MKQKSLPIISITVVTLSLVLSGVRSLAQSKQGPVTMTASVEGSSTVVLGEPILLNLAVQNSSDQPASIYTHEADSTPLITERFIEAGGKPVAPVVKFLDKPQKTDVMHVWNGISLRANDSNSWQSLASAGITFPHPGNYVLQVHVQYPYVVGDIDQGSHYVLKNDYSFPLKIVESNSSSLQIIAEQFHKSIMQTSDVNKRSLLIKSLFSMPETVYPAWQSLIEEPKLDGGELSETVVELAKLKTIKSADLLAEIIWSPSQPRSVIAEAAPGSYLDKMYDAGNPALKKHIEGLYKQNGSEMSNYRTE